MAKINTKTEINVDDFYDCLSDMEKYDLADKLFEDNQYDLDNFYDSLDVNNKLKLKDKLTDDFLIQPKYNNVDIKKYLTNADKFNASISNLSGKSHMLTHQETEWLINLSEKYKYFD
jgi:sRNA-binding regulator protein Hfq